MKSLNFWSNSKSAKNMSYFEYSDCDGYDSDEYDDAVQSSDGIKCEVKVTSIPLNFSILMNSSQMKQNHLSRFASIQSRNHSAMVKVFESETCQQGKVEIPKYLRLSLNLSEGDTVAIKPCDAKSPASAIQIVPLFDTGNTDYSSDLIKYFQTDFHLVGQGIAFSFYTRGSILSFKINKTIPTEPCYTTPKTRIYLVKNEDSKNMSLGKHLSDLVIPSDLLKLKEKLIDLPIQYPNILYSVGVRNSNAVIFYGAKGYGKTSILKAIAKDSHVPYMFVNTPDLLKLIDINLKKALEELKSCFSFAIKVSEEPPSILIFDDFDDLACGIKGAKTPQKRQFVSLFISLLDRALDVPGIVVIASASSKANFDDSLRRYGRFCFEVELKPPKSAQRAEIIKKNTVGINFEKQLLQKISKKPTKNKCCSEVETIADIAVMEMIQEKIHGNDSVFPKDNEIYEAFNNSILKLEHFPVSIAESNSNSDINQLAQVENKSENDSTQDKTIHVDNDLSLDSFENRQHISQYNQQPQQQNNQSNNDLFNVDQNQQLQQPQNNLFDMYLLNNSQNQQSQSNNLFNTNQSQQNSSLPKQSSIDFFNMSSNQDTFNKSQEPTQINNSSSKESDKEEIENNNRDDKHIFNNLNKNNEVANNNNIDKNNNNNDPFSNNNNNAFANNNSNSGFNNNNNKGFGNDISNNTLDNNNIPFGNNDNNNNSIGNKNSNDPFSNNNNGFDNSNNNNTLSNSSDPFGNNNNNSNGFGNNNNNDPFGNNNNNVSGNNNDPFGNNNNNNGSGNNNNNNPFGNNNNKGFGNNNDPFGNNNNNNNNNGFGNNNNNDPFGNNNNNNGSGNNNNNNGFSNNNSNDPFGNNNNNGFGNNNNNDSFGNNNNNVPFGNNNGFGNSNNNDPFSNNTNNNNGFGNNNSNDPFGNNTNNNGFGNNNSNDPFGNNNNNNGFGNNSPFGNNNNNNGFGNNNNNPFGNNNNGFGNNNSSPFGNNNNNNNGFSNNTNNVPFGNNNNNGGFNNNNFGNNVPFGNNNNNSFGNNNNNDPFGYNNNNGFSNNNNNNTFGNNNGFNNNNNNSNQQKDIFASFNPF